MGPPMGPPPRKNRTGRTLSIVGGSIVFVLLLSYFGNRGSDARDAANSAGSFPAAEYRLTVPKTLLDTEYELVKDDSAATNDEMEKGGYTSGPNEWVHLATNDGTYDGYAAPWQG